MAKKTKTASTRKTSPRRARLSKTTSTKGVLSKDKAPAVIYAQVSPRSISGVSMFEGQERIDSRTVTNFFSDGDVIQASVARLQEAGFSILQISPLTINISGSPAAYRKAFEQQSVLWESSRVCIAL